MVRLWSLRKRKACGAGWGCAVHAPRDSPPGSGSGGGLHPSHHIHLPELDLRHVSAGPAACGHAGAAGACLPAPLPQAQPASRLPVPPRLPGIPHVLAGMPCRRQVCPVLRFLKSIFWSFKLVLSGVGATA